MANIRGMKDAFKKPQNLVVSMQFIPESQYMAKDKDGKDVERTRPAAYVVDAQLDHRDHQDKNLHLTTYTGTGKDGKAVSYHGEMYTENQAKKIMEAGDFRNVNEGSDKPACYVGTVSGYLMRNTHKTKDAVQQRGLMLNTKADMGKSDHPYVDDLRTLQNATMHAAAEADKAARAAKQAEGPVAADPQAATAEKAEKTTKKRTAKKSVSKPKAPKTTQVEAPEAGDAELEV